jgi:DNA-binding IclR family transcriptional regulator
MSRSPEGLVTTNALVLLVVHLTPNASFVEIAERLAINESTVRRSIKQLEEQGFLRHDREGRRSFYEVQKSARITSKSLAKTGDLMWLLAETATVD